MQKDIKAPTIEDIKKQWASLGDNYSQMDSCPQTYFYTLACMLKLDCGKKILQIACGTGRLLPLIIDVKNPQSTYYATDISQKMLQLLKDRLSNHLQKYQSTLTLQQWMNKQKIKIALVNGEQSLEGQIPEQPKQIIANLVLMLTADPQKMLLNLANHSLKGCLLGLSIWGNKSNHNYYTIFPQLIKQYGFPQPPKSRSNFHLYRNLSDMAQKCGWQIILNWQQNSVLPYLNPKETQQFAHLVTSKMSYLSFDQQKKLETGFIQRINHILLQKKTALTFAAECYILRKL